MGRNSGWIRAVALCLAVGALASCGADRRVTYSGGTLEPVVAADEKRGRELAVEGMRLLKDADSVRIGVETAAAAGRRKVSLHMDRDSNCTGTFDSGPTQRGDLVIISGDATYVRFSDRALDEMLDMGARRGPTVAARVRERAALARGKYLKIPTGSAARGPAVPLGNCDLDRFTGAMPGAPDADDSFKALPETRRYGTRVVPVVESTADQETTLYVAARGKPYVLGVRVAEGGGDGAMTMRFSGYDEPVAARAPAPARTLDISEVGSGGGSLFEV
ncbi:hypothetical protein [Streptomyces sp. NPDC047123]|uniref:hypothetical protein n=1 Tax=Streptomyces sp. NPDC047123 TaxID=3155622 RepID=UPI0033C4BBF9